MLTPTFTRSRSPLLAIRAAQSLACAFLPGVMLVSCTEAPNAPGVHPLLAVGSGGAYTAQFDDAASNKLRSDDGTTYTDAVRCVSSLRTAGGFYQLRTIANTVECKAVQRPGWRWFTIDLGAGNTHDLDQDGDAEPIEHAPGRLLTADAFANAATSTSARIYILKVNADSSTTQDAAWHLVYTVPAAVATTLTGGRVITAGPEDVTLSKLAVVGRKVVWSQVGTASLPFRLSLEP